ncbi:hypothetical protein Cyrtocomes_00853 [Candidatus Cyrtobacter comes]|uniref:Uncharacterized protein n=1 Tax=Candidatus Cyrtobacter comes TaxID=675776 RepID=A0ABU5L8M5_9RICK|nr:hypothetical protein [Candidatus Cyrtobacter comes]MDZ5762469.1 hypothetical protein [Candidatus Cyrtobacter comes]
MAETYASHLKLANNALNSLRDSNVSIEEKKQAAQAYLDYEKKIWNQLVELRSKYNFLEEVKKFIHNLVNEVENNKALASYIQEDPLLLHPKSNMHAENFR